MKILIIVLLLTSELILAQFSTQDNMWTTRNGKRFFAIGVNVGSLPDPNSTTSYNDKVCSETAFTSAREVFNLLYQPYIKFVILISH